MKISSYKELIVWQKSMDLVKEVWGELNIDAEKTQWDNYIK